jgi:homoserine acetyltransferase
MPKSRLSCLLFLGLISGPTEVGSQSAPSVTRLGDCALVNGVTLHDCRIAYRRYGISNAPATNSILVLTWLAGTSQDWVGLFGPEGLIDTTRFQVIVVDAFGNGVSSSPSNTIGAVFPQITIEDMVAGQYRLLTEVLAVTHLRAVVGFSMGGMQVFEWAASHPEFVDRFVSINGTPRPSRNDRAWLRTEVAIIESGIRHGVPKDSLYKMIAGINTLITNVQERINRRNSDEADSLLAVAAANLARAVHLEDWVAQSRAVLAYNLDSRPSVKAGVVALGRRFLVINSPDDRTISAEPALAFARRIGADTLVVRSSCGHQVLFCETAAIGRTVQQFLAR